MEDNEVRSTSKQAHVSYSPNGKQTAARLLIYQVLRCFRVVWSQFWASSKCLCKFRLHFAPAVTWAWEMIVKHRQIVVAAHVGRTYTTMNCGLRMLYFPDSWNEASKKRSDWDFLRMLIVMSVKVTLTDKLLKVTSALRVIFSVIEDKCSGGQRSSKHF